MTSTHISVIAKPLADSRVQVNTGLKIPVTVSAPDSRPSPLWLTGTGSVLAAGAILLWILNKYRRRRKRKQFPTEDNRVGEKQ